MLVYAGGHIGCVGAVEGDSTLVTFGRFLVLVALVAGDLVDCVHVGCFDSDSVTYLSFEYYENRVFESLRKAVTCCYVFVTVGYSG